MSRFKQKFYSGVMIIMLGFCATSGHALDLQSTDTQSDPFESFRSGISAYKNGHKSEAVKSLRYAAEMGHRGASWKLGRMYAQGDGVPENDYQAYEYFVQIVQAETERGSADESYVSDALVEVATYIRQGIVNSPVKANPAYARTLFMRAATNYGNPQAQFMLGLMLYRGEGGDKNPVQAGRWFQAAAKKGHPAAQAMLGQMLFQAGKTVRGLALMTAGYERATPEDKTWIRPMQERAFAIVGEADRRTAVLLASDLIQNNGL